MSDWLLRQTYGFGAAHIPLCAEPHATAGAEWSVREGVRAARASAGTWRDVFGLAPALAMGLVISLAPLLALLQQSLTAPDVELVLLETPARSEPPPAPAVPIPEPVAVAEEIPPPPVEVPEEIPPPPPVEVAEEIPPPPPRPAVPAPPEPPPVVAVAQPAPPPARSRAPVVPAPPTAPRIEPVALGAAPAEPTPWRSVRSEAAPASAPVVRPALVAFASPAPVEDPAPPTPSARSIRTAAPVVAPTESRRTPPPVRFAAALPAAPAASAAAPPPPSLRPERPTEHATAAPARESKPGLRGVALASLASCRTDAMEDDLKQRVLAEVRGRDLCESAAGRYVFVETRNLNAFLMYVQRAQSRREADRCVELSLALDCLRQRGGSRAGRV